MRTYKVNNPNTLYQNMMNTARTLASINGVAILESYATRGRRCGCRACFDCAALEIAVLKTCESVMEPELRDLRAKAARLAWLESRIKT